MLLEIIFLAVVAALILNHLIKILGREDDDIAPVNKVVQKEVEVKDVSYEEISVHEAGLSEEIKKNLAKIKKSDKKFNVNEFLAKSKEAFKMVIEALNKGDEKTLKMLLHPDVFKVFSLELKNRKEANKIVENLLVSIQEVKILDCTFTSSNASVKVEIKSEQINYVQDQDGNLLTGSKSKILQPVDNWTFTKNTNNPRDFWRLKETS